MPSVKKVSTAVVKRKLSESGTPKENKENPQKNRKVEKTETPTVNPNISGRLRSRNRATPNYSESANSPEEKTPEKLPPIKYKGKIEYYTQSQDIAFASDQLLEWVEKQTDKEKIPIAFDMEWPFSFKTGPGKSALIQLAADVKLCYLFHISELKKLPAVLIKLLNHPKVVLHGVNIKNDFRKLARDFPEVDAEPLIAQCKDLGVWCNEVMGTGGRWSLERLVEYICKLKIDKNKAVRMSRWHIQPLEDVQKLYAAIDVYISQVIYYDLEKNEKIKQEAEEKFLESHGEKALKAIKDLGENFV